MSEKSRIFHTLLFILTSLYIKVEKRLRLYKRLSSFNEKSFLKPLILNRAPLTIPFHYYQQATCQWQFVKIGLLFSVQYQNYHISQYKDFYSSSSTTSQSYTDLGILIWILEYTMWTFQDFSATQILREITFGHFEDPKAVSIIVKNGRF